MWKQENGNLNFKQLRSNRLYLKWILLSQSLVMTLFNDIIIIIKKIMGCNESRKPNKISFDDVVT